MNSETIANTLGEKTKITKEELKERIEAKLITRGIFNAMKATPEQLYQASFLAMKDIMLEYREQFKKRTKAANGKRICYLCMEFLVGRAVYNNLLCLDLLKDAETALGELGAELSDMEEIEDAALGNNNNLFYFGA